MNTFNVKIGETGAILRVTFLGRDEGISDATLVQLRFVVAGTTYTRTMTADGAASAYYQFTTDDFVILSTLKTVECDFKVTTPSGIFFWPKPGRDRISVEVPIT